MLLCVMGLAFNWLIGKSFGLEVIFNMKKYLLPTEFEGRTLSYGPSFFLLDLRPKREARGP